jgi:hypothetical protein
VQLPQGHQFLIDLGVGDAGGGHHDQAARLEGATATGVGGDSFAQVSSAEGRVALGLVHRGGSLVEERHHVDALLVLARPTKQPSLPCPVDLKSQRYHQMLNRFPRQVVRVQQ